MQGRSNIRLGELLIERGVITRDQLNIALQAQNTSGKRLGQTLVRLGYANETAILSALTVIAVPEQDQATTNNSGRALRSFKTGWVVAVASVLLVFVCAGLFFSTDEPDSTGNLEKVQVQGSDHKDAPEESEQPLAETSISEPAYGSEYDDASTSEDYLQSAPETFEPEPVLEFAQVSFTEPEPIVDETDLADASEDSKASVSSDEQANIEGLDSLRDIDSSEPTVKSVPENVTSTSSALAQIQNIRTSATTSDMSVVFVADQSIKQGVERIYLNDTEVMYVFKGFSLAPEVSKDIPNYDWLEQSHFEQTDEALVWAFTMKATGDAKYHELEPNRSNRNYRFVVKIRRR